MIAANPENVLSRAAEWPVHVLEGSVSEVIAILAVAGLGFAMLLGRIPVRRVGAIGIGTFLLFGASSVSKGLMELVQPASAPTLTGSEVVPDPIPVTPSSQPVIDPYAGATVRR